MKKILSILTIFVIAAIYNNVSADGLNRFASRFIIDENILGSNKIPLDSLVLDKSELNEKVIVNGDTVSIVLPDKNYGRFDRGLYNYLFVPKGEWSFGLTASYGEFGTEDVQVLSMLKDFDIKIKAYSIKPSVAYFFKSNQSVGVKFNYSRSYVDLNNLTVDFDEDINFSLRDISYYQQTYTTSLFYRNYVGLGRQKRFAIFNEVDLSFGAGSSRFKRLYNGEPRDTKTSITEASLNFSPGLCVFIMDYVSFNVSFGVFGLNMRNEKQTTDGVDEGSRFTSGANFKFNIFNINFGMAVHI